MRISAAAPFSYPLFCTYSMCVCVCELLDALPGSSFSTSTHTHRAIASMELLNF